MMRKAAETLYTFPFFLSTFDFLPRDVPAHLPRHNGNTGVFWGGLKKKKELVQLIGDTVWRG